MHEIHEIEKKLCQDAQRISKRHGGHQWLSLWGDIQGRIRIFVDA